MIFDPSLDDKDEFDSYNGAVRPAPKLPYTVEPNERFKHLPQEALLIGQNDQSWRYILCKLQSSALSPQHPEVLIVELEGHELLLEK